MPDFQEQDYWQTNAFCCQVCCTVAILANWVTWRRSRCSIEQETFSSKRVNLQALSLLWVQKPQVSGILYQNYSLLLLPCHDSSALVCPSSPLSDEAYHAKTDDGKMNHSPWPSMFS